MITLLNSVVYPTVSYALTSGPHQPEYTSYEDASAADMVNLLTGDFTFNMPLLTVPVGEEGGFTVPLSYHAGIGSEQEASWVGLGWNINVGSITRSINGFPDDANGESQIVNVKDLTGTRGWSSNFLGTSIGWDSQIGHYGVINLGVEIGYSNGGLTSVGLAGLSVSGGDVSFDAAKFAMTVVQVVMAVATYGASEGANVAGQVAFDIAIGLYLEAALPNYTPSLGAQGYWKYNKRTEKRLFHTNYWITLDQTRIEDMYGILNLDKANQNASSGSNYSDDPNFVKIRNSVGGTQTAVKRFIKSSSTSNKGAASDINIDLSAAANYSDNKSPALLAYDNFQVNGPGISGGIKPYRMEIGSVSAPREMTSKHIRLNPIQYMDYGSNKVPFVYEGAMSNRYYHHVGASSSVTSPSFYHGVSSTKTNVGGSDNPYALQYNLNDVTFANQRVRSDVSLNKKIPQGINVQWLTNAEIKNTTGKFLNSPYVDYFDGGASGPRHEFRFRYTFGLKETTINSYSATNGVINFSSNEGSNFIVNETVDAAVFDLLPRNDGSGGIIYTYEIVSQYTGLVVTAASSNQITVNAPINVSGDSYVSIVTRGLKKDHSIGAYVITSADGMNYHYSIPVYDYNFSTKSEKKSDPNKNSTITRYGQFANTWLLTAITGPDFVDRGGVSNSGNGVIDESDWGYWVKFNYGSYSTDYMWRTPYTGANMDADDIYQTYAQGNKEKYYLNSIETRSHVALFLKDVRKDAKDASTLKKPSLRLSEIALLTKGAYNELTDPNKMYQLKNCSGIINGTYQTSDSPDINADASDNITGNRLTYIQQNALRRIVFNADYTLCQGPGLNSDTGLGKLTLKTISVLGRNSSKIFPDYKFSYSNNPSYDPNKWDGWGMYSSTGTSTGTSHKASQIDSDGWAWSLTSIKSPQGNEIAMEYERDEYSSISNSISVPSFSVAANDLDLSDGNTSLSSPSFQNGERVNVVQWESYTCSVVDWCEDQAGAMNECIQTYTYPVSQSSEGTVQGSIVQLDNPLSSGTYECNGSSVMASVTNVNVFSLGDDRKGGNIRIKSITLKDDISNVQNKTRYIYTKETQPWSTSSGVVSVEPDYIRSTEYDFYKWLGYPTTPVMYSKVTVLTGKLSNDSDYITKQVYEFETPNKNMYSINPSSEAVIKDKELFNTYQYSVAVYKDYQTQVKNEITRRLSKIGKLKSVKVYDKPGNLYSSQSLVYTENPLNDNINNYQGVFTEGTLLFEIIQTGPDNTTFRRYHKANRTTVVDYPYTLQKVINTIDGQTTETENKSWDLLTGIVLETHSKSPLGIKIKSVMEPAYTKYPELGSKAENPSNKNMLTQIAANYSYRVDNGGNELGLTGASVSVWNKEWGNYRIQDGNGNYTDNADLDADNNTIIDATEAANKIWRKHTTYVWKGDYSRLQPDGTHTFGPSDKFNFADPQSNLKWQRLGSNERYSHNSNLLESKSLNDVYSSTKLGYNNTLTLASAVNAKYEEMAYSSAEDRLSTTSPYFGGEVKLGSGTIVSTTAHTGKQALLVSSGYGFVFKSSSISANKTYRASVWTNSTEGRIYYKLGTSGTEICPLPITSQQVEVKDGSAWYRLDVNIPVGSNSIIEVGVKSNNGSPVVFDDFRYQPFDAGMTCYVYNPSTLQLEYVLDNDNIYTRYEYNDRGLLIKTYREIIKLNGEKLVSESKNDFRRFHIDQ